MLKSVLLENEKKKTKRCKPPKNNKKFSPKRYKRDTGKGRK